MCVIDLLLFIVTIVLMVGFIVGVASVYTHEKERFNDGICPKCGHKLVCFDMDSSGARMYKCSNPDCNHWVDVSYNYIDKNYHEVK